MELAGAVKSTRYAVLALPSRNIIVLIFKPAESRTIGVLCHNVMFTVFGFKLNRDLYPSLADLKLLLCNSVKTDYSEHDSFYVLYIYPFYYS